MVKHAKKNVTTCRSQGSRGIGWAVKKNTSTAVTHGPASCPKPTDFIATAPTTCSRTQWNASQTPTATIWKRKTMEPTFRRAGKQQKTFLLTTQDIPISVAWKPSDAFPEPNGTLQGSHTPKDTLDTEGMVSTSSDEFSIWSCLATYCVHMHA